MGGWVGRRTEVKGGLEKAGHVGLPDKVVYEVQEDVASSGARGQEGKPLPVVVLLCGEKWVGGWVGGWVEGESRAV